MGSRGIMRTRANPTTSSLTLTWAWWGSLGEHSGDEFLHPGCSMQRAITPRLARHWNDWLARLDCEAPQYAGASPGRAEKPSDKVTSRTTLQTRCSGTNPSSTAVVMIQRRKLLPNSADYLPTVLQKRSAIDFVNTALSRSSLQAHSACSQQIQTWE